MIINVTKKDISKCKGDFEDSQSCAIYHALVRHNLPVEQVLFKFIIFERATLALSKKVEKWQSKAVINGKAKPIKFRIKDPR